MPRLFGLVLALLVVSACSAPKEDAPPRTAEQQRQVDSTIGASALPGARGVQGAMRAADSSAKRNALLDSLSKAP